MAGKDDEEDGEKKKEAIHTVDVDISVVLGKSNLRVHQLLKLGRGAVVELEQKTSDPVEIYANDILIARGEVVVTAGDKIGVTLTELVKSVYANADD
ncbi:MAG: FliM/FliN family flagellar motor switch protein [Rhodobacteraceae bacterium]|nr:FliM/FliN family flagellar motor switch protein [Paracoccaceae bacterium]